MGAPAVNNQPPSACEKSLLRSFSAIHYSHIDARSYDASDSYIGGHRCSSSKRDHWNDKRGGNCPSPPSPTPTRPIIKVKNELPALPFAKTGLSHPRRESVRGNLVKSKKKFQSRHSLFTAGVAQEMVRTLAKETKQKRQQLMHGIADSNDSPRRRAFVSFAPSHCSNSMSMNTGKRNMVAEHYNGFRRDYRIGESLRCPSHMIDEPTLEKALQGVNSLSKHDFAFVKRSDGSYSYAILAYRSMEPGKGTMPMEECMTFVINDAGSSKVLHKRHWSQYIRRVATMEKEDPQPVKTEVKTHAAHRSPPSLDKHLKAYSALFCQEINPPVLCQEIEEENVPFPPRLVEFVPRSQIDEECSLISSVSDRARAQSRRSSSRW